MIKIHYTRINSYNTKELRWGCLAVEHLKRPPSLGLLASASRDTKMTDLYPQIQTA